MLLHVELNRPAKWCCHTGVCDQCMSILDQISEEIRQIITNEDSLSIEEWKWNSRNFGQYLFLQVRTVRREVERDLLQIGKRYDLITFVCDSINIHPDRRGRALYQQRSPLVEARTSRHQ